MRMSPKLSDIAALSDQELASRYDAHAQNTVVGTAFYLCGPVCGVVVRYNKSQSLC